MLTCTPNTYQIPNAKMVITEDSNWCSIFNEVIDVCSFRLVPITIFSYRQCDHGVPSNEEFFARVLENHHIESDNGLH